jgi:competence protein ComEA
MNAESDAPVNDESIATPSTPATDPKTESLELPMFLKADLAVALGVMLLTVSALSGYLLFRWCFPDNRPQIYRPAQLQYEYWIDINQATWVEWMLLPEIGDKLAHKIVDYRTEHGPFKAIDDLLKINGIGKKNFENIKPHLRCAECEVH